MNSKILLFICFFVTIQFFCNIDIKSPNMEKISKVTEFDKPPEWTKDVIWYQIFVDRFRNGDASNDPTVYDITGAYTSFIPKNWHVTPWTQDWYKEDDYFVELEGKPDFGGNIISKFTQKVQLRHYGGDLQGVLDKMDYIDSLGVTAIYFNPLNDAPSLHKYDARNWRHIDRNFGPEPKKDSLTIASEIPDNPDTWKFTEADKLFLKVIDEFHKRNIRVILDYSWNHTGHTFWAWKDILTNQEKSKYKDWYEILSFDDPKTEQDEFKYKSWSGVTELTEVKKSQNNNNSDNFHPIQGNIYSEELKKHIFNVTKRWLDPNGDGNPEDGVDGFRLDVAAELPVGFWREYRSFVKNINPDAFLIGEVWWEAWPDKLLDPTPYLKGDVFDAVMNYRWYRDARHFFNQSPNKIKVSEFVKKLDSLNLNLRKDNVYSMMNLVSSHDAPRVLTSLYNKNKYKFNSSPDGNPKYKIDKPDEKTYQTLKLLLIHQFTYIGSPHIWAGDEMGMWGADDPSCRKPLIWQDYKFENEIEHPLKIKKPVNKVEFDTALFNFYKKIISIRKNNKVLSSGEIEFILIDDKNEVLAYSRYDKNDEVIVVFNTSKKEKNITVPCRFDSKYSEILNNYNVIKKYNNLIINLPARTAVIIKKN